MLPHSPRTIALRRPLLRAVHHRGAGPTLLTTNPPSKPSFFFSPSAHHHNHHPPRSNFLTNFLSQPPTPTLRPPRFPNSTPQDNNNNNPHLPLQIHPQSEYHYHHVLRRSLLLLPRQSKPRHLIPHRQIHFNLPIPTKTPIDQFRQHRDSCAVGKD